MYSVVCGFQSDRVSIAKGDDGHRRRRSSGPASEDSVPEILCEITLRFDGEATNDEKEKVKEGTDEDARAKVKTKMKPKPKWRNDKLTWKNTWVPKRFLPTTKEYG